MVPVTAAACPVLLHGQDSAQAQTHVLHSTPHDLKGGFCIAETANGTDGYQKPAPKLMVCNRGEVARRVIRTANHHGLETIAIYTEVGYCWYCSCAAAALFAVMRMAAKTWLWETMCALRTCTCLLLLGCDGCPPHPQCMQQHLQRVTCRLQLLNSHVHRSAGDYCVS